MAAPLMIAFNKGRLRRCSSPQPRYGLSVLADYLGVERSGLSLELGKMRGEGLLDFHKSHFLLKVPETDGLPPSAR